jgi:hypothetical protein
MAHVALKASNVARGNGALCRCSAVETSSRSVQTVGRWVRIDEDNDQTACRRTVGTLIKSHAVAGDDST